jgi:hypothetical protein
MRCKEDCAEMQKDIRDALWALLCSVTPNEFEEKWEMIQEEWADQKAWLKYLNKEWIIMKECWAHAWWKVSLFYDLLQNLIFHSFCSACVLQD